MLVVPRGDRDGICRLSAWYHLFYVHDLPLPKAYKHLKTKATFAKSEPKFISRFTGATPRNI